MGVQALKERHPDISHHQSRKAIETASPLPMPSLLAWDISHHQSRKAIETRASWYSNSFSAGDISHHQSRKAIETQQRCRLGYRYPHSNISHHQSRKAIETLVPGVATYNKGKISAIIKAERQLRRFPSPASPDGEVRISAIIKAERQLRQVARGRDSRGIQRISAIIKAERQLRLHPARKPLPTRVGYISHHQSRKAIETMTEAAYAAYVGAYQPSSKPKGN